MYICLCVGDVQVVFTAANHLCEIYKASRFCSSVDDWSPYQPKHYTTLALIHGRGMRTNATVITVTQELAVAGRITTDFSSQSCVGTDQSKYAGATKNISDIFTPVLTTNGCAEGPNLVLIEGAPGIGISKRNCFSMGC